MTQRKIAFRGQRLDNRDWVVGSLAVSGFRTFILVYRNEETPNILSSWTEFEVDPKTVGQFTCLTDKNGVEIYEGDIVRISSDEYYSDENMSIGSDGEEWEFTGKVEMNSAMWLVSNKDRDYIPFCNTLSGDMSAEILGSVHTNPELLNA